MTNKNRERLGWVLFCIFFMTAMLSGLRLLANLILLLTK